MTDPARLLAVACALLLAFAALAVVLGRPSAAARLSSETRRKAVHVAMGTLSAALPWAVFGVAAVPLLAAILVVALALVRAVPALRGRLGHGFLDVKRASVGDLAFPAGIAAAWLVSGGRAAPFVAAVLVLAWGDAAAALVGRAWARAHGACDGRKTAAGSAALVVTACAAIGGVLVLLDEMPVASALGVALAVAAVSALVEALATDGWDNLMLPPVAAALLLRLRGADAATLAAVTLAASGLVIVLLRATQAPASRARETTGFAS